MTGRIKYQVRTGHGPAWPGSASLRTVFQGQHPDIAAALQQARELAAAGERFPGVNNMAGQPAAVLPVCDHVVSVDLGWCGRGDIGPDGRCPYHPADRPGTAVQGALWELVAGAR
ncbi:MAG: hypothetical protein JWO67_2260 [Streptosporangiaceae bacterium]|nr:hypothetical protein [Streptosporangiaceae bacterium]